MVREANLSAGGFVVIHAQGSSGPIIGVSEYLTPGSHENVQIELFNVPGQQFNQSRLEQSQTLVASAYLDTNNNRRLDFLSGSDDQPYRQSSGRPVTNPAFVSVIGTAEQARANLTADVTFTDQTAFDGVVTVREATLSDGGFVVIQTENGSKADPVGSVVGVSRYLPPGTHQDVRVELFAVPGANNTSSARSNLDAPVAMVATVNLDTNDNQRFDFVATNGRADVAYLQSDGGPLSNPATVRPASSTATGTTAGSGATTTTATTGTGQGETTTNSTPATDTTGTGAGATTSPSTGTTDGGSDGGTTTETSGPGFGLTVALVAVLSLAMLLRRRD